MISRYGFVYAVNIDINTVILRSGEKLFEALLANKEYHKNGS